jgi:peroxiredoxin
MGDDTRCAGEFFYSKESGGNMALQVGQPAPDFELSAVTGDQKHKFKLSDLKGKKNVVIAFYPLDWTPV